MSLSAGLMLMAAAQGSPWDDPAPTGRWAGSTAKLASELLTLEMANDAVSHVVARGIFVGGPPLSVRFEGRPAQTSDGFCSRKTYYVSIMQKSEDGEGEPQKPVVGSKLRLGNCDGLFAHVNPGPNLDDAKKVFAWLGWAQHLAQGPSQLPFAVTCKSETEQDRCAIGARAALAALPLGKTTAVTRNFYRVPHRWEVAVTESEPGQLYWDVEIDATPGAASIDLGWSIPAPF